jgi:hypothetical protein
MKFSANAVRVLHPVGIQNLNLGKFTIINGSLERYLCLTNFDIKGTEFERVRLAVLLLNMCDIHHQKFLGRISEVTFRTGLACYQNSNAWH